jgi:hypothetical protein
MFFMYLSMFAYEPGQPQREIDESGDKTVIHFHICIKLEVLPKP